VVCLCLLLVLHLLFCCLRRLSLCCPSWRDVRFIVVDHEVCFLRHPATEYALCVLHLEVYC
jgi:hypothetical protein